MQLDLLSLESAPTAPTATPKPVSKKKTPALPQLSLSEEQENIGVTERALPVLSLDTQATDIDLEANDDCLHTADFDKHKGLEKEPGAFKTISEAAKLLGVQQHVLRFWETRFSQIKPLKLAGGRRYYRPEDMEILGTIKHLLYKQGYTIKGAKKAFSLRKKILSDTPLTIQDSVQALPEPRKRILTEKQRGQLAGLRYELLELRATLSMRIS